MKTLFLVSVIGSALLFAGQDIDLSTQSASNSTFTPYSTAASFTVDMAFHYTDSNLGMAGGLHPCSIMVVGLDCQIIWISTTDFRLQLYNVNEAGGPTCQMQLAGLTLNYTTIRFIHDVVSGQDTCQLTDIAGIQTSTSFTAGASSGTNANYVFLFGDGSGEDIYWSYLRIYNYAFSTAAKPPTTGEFTTGSAGSCSASAANALVYWNFDLCNNTGSLTDISGNGKDAVMSSGSPTYTNSLGQATPYTPTPVMISATISTLDNNRLFIAGYPEYGISFDTTTNHTNHMDCSNSYSQVDLVDSTSCSWDALSGPTSPTFTGSTSTIPVVTNLSDTRPGFVDYNMRLTITDHSGNTAIATQHVGAVPLDINGVVQPMASDTNNNQTKFFGPMIGFGYNPWGYFDEREIYAFAVGQLTAGNSNIAGYNATTTWTTPATGTVSYPFNGKGGFSCTTLSAGISATTLSIPITDASCLSLSSLPTWIFVGVSGNQDEMIRICSTTGTTGPQTLTACYDGRGISGAYEFGGGTAVPAQMWSINTLVGEYRIQGSSTQFVTDAARPLCPAGAPGPPGPVVYSTGTLSVTHSSTTLTGSGTTWNSANGVVEGDMIAVAGTTTSGTPFAFWRRIITVGSTTQITIDHAYPSTADDLTGLSYKITSTRYVSLDVCTTGTTCSDTDPQTIRMLQNTEGCESATAAFALFAHDIITFDGVSFTGMAFSYKDSLGATSAQGPNFYGPGYGARQLWLRSGLTRAYSTANLIDDLWVNDPEVSGGWTGSPQPLLMGGGMIGALADLVFNSATVLQWSNVEHLGTNWGPDYTLGCNGVDTRDSGILQGFTNLLALFDPNNHSTWQTYAAGWYSRDVSTTQPVTSSTGCRGSDNSWGNSLNWAASTPTVDVVHTAAGVHTPGTVTAHTGIFSPSQCNVTASGTATATKGSASLSVVSGSFIAGVQIVVVGTNNSATTTAWLPTAYVLNSSSSVSLGGLWYGDSGTVDWAITTNSTPVGQDNVTIAASNDDPLTMHQQVCQYTNATHIQIWPAWQAATDSTGNLSPFQNSGTSITGYFQQAFMLGGYKESALRWGSLNPDATIAANYATLTPLAASWLHSTGWDPTSKSMNYARLGDFYEPDITVATGTDYRQMTSQVGANPSAIQNGRVLNAESTNGVSIYYLNNIGTPGRDYADTVYCAVWGYSAWTLPGYCTDSLYLGPSSNLGNADLNSFKWPGFFFGIGTGQQWPAIRNPVIIISSPYTQIQGLIKTLSIYIK